MNQLFQHLLSGSTLRSFSFLIIILFSSPAILYAQTNQLITGMVTTSEDNSPLPGVTIMIKGTTNGTSTDLDGKYQIRANPQDILVFNYTGYILKEVAVGNQSIIDITLDSDQKQLDEIVVIGYGQENVPTSPAPSLQSK